jgi:hypothetical protein
VGFELLSMAGPGMHQVRDKVGGIKVGARSLLMAQARPVQGRSETKERKASRVKRERERLGHGTLGPNA